MGPSISPHKFINSSYINKRLEEDKSWLYQLEVELKVSRKHDNSIYLRYGNSDMILKLA